MLKRIIAPVLALILTVPLTAGAASSGFHGPGNYTDTANAYFFDYWNAILVDNKQVIDDFNYDEFYAGSVLYLPVMVYPGNAATESPVAENMFRTDNVGISSKVLTGGDFVEEIEVVDGRREKINGLPATMFVKIPLVEHYEHFTANEIHIQFVLSVNGVGYQDTLINLSCYIINRVQNVNRRSVYPVGRPTEVHVRRPFSGEVTFDFGENIRYTNRVYAGERYYFSLSREPQPNISRMNAERNTYLEFYNFRGDKDTFRARGSLEIPVRRDRLSRGRGEPESLFIYRIMGDSLQSMGADEVSFDARLNRLTIRTDTLENYVVSNIALLREIEDEESIDILRTGYAELMTDEELEELEDILGGLEEDFVPPPPGGPVGELPVNGTLPRLNSEVPAVPASEVVETDEDGYVPEESEFFGGYLDAAPISTVNEGSAANPSTSDGSRVLPAAMMMCLSGAGLLLSKRVGGIRRPAGR